MVKSDDYIFGCFCQVCHLVASLDDDNDDWNCRGWDNGNCVRSTVWNIKKFTLTKNSWNQLHIKCKWDIIQLIWVWCNFWSKIQKSKFLKFSHCVLDPTLKGWAYTWPITFTAQVPTTALRSLSVIATADFRVSSELDIV